MKKIKHFCGISLLVATSLTACSPDNSWELSGGNMKHFGFVTSVADNESSATRGAKVGTASLADVHGAFKVYAYLDGDLSKPFYETDDEDQPVMTAPFADITYTHWKTIGTDEYWNSAAADDFYWWQEDDLRFFAYAPTSLGLTATNFDSSGNITFAYSVPAGTSGSANAAVSQPDVLVTSSPVVGRDDADKVTDPADSNTEYYTSWLHFYHALCAVNFKVGTLSEGATIDKIVLKNLASQGTCTFTRPNTTSESVYQSKASSDVISWSITSGHGADGEYAQAFGTHIVESASRDLGEGKISTGDMLYANDISKDFILIPQEFPNPACTYNSATDPTIIIYASVGGTALEPKSARLLGAAHPTVAGKWCWLPGRYYTYTLSGTFEPMNLTLTLGTYPWTLSEDPSAKLH